jgi:hypothetical protein
MARMDEATRKRLRAGRLMLAGKTPAEAAPCGGRGAADGVRHPNQRIDEPLPHRWRPPA